MLEIIGRGTVGGFLIIVDPNGEKRGRFFQYLFDLNEFKKWIDEGVEIVYKTCFFSDGGTWMQTGLPKEEGVGFGYAAWRMQCNVCGHKYWSVKMVDCETLCPNTDKHEPAA